MRIAGSVAIVTGASSGIGRATALELAARGATVVAAARRADRLDALVAQCRERAPHSRAVPADLAQRDACESLVAAVERELGHIDIIVNNAGISIRRPAMRTTADDVERVFAINYFAAVRTASAAMPGMLARRRGSIVNVTSVAGGLPNPQESAYAASKAALAMWSHGLAVDLHGTGVHAGVVSPGPIDTEIWALDETPAAYKGKLFPPEVVARAVARCIERETVHVTVPRRFGIPPAMYWIAGRPMRWGLRRFDARAKQPFDATPNTGSSETGPNKKPD